MSGPRDEETAKRKAAALRKNLRRRKTSDGAAGPKKETAPQTNAESENKH